MDFNTFFTLFHLVSAYVPSNLEENDSSNHKISGYGLVLKDDIIHAPKHTLHIPLILQPAADSSESFTVNTTASPSCFHISNRKAIRMNFHD